MANITLDNLDDVFRYHGPDPVQIEKYQKINIAVKECAKVILENAPHSRERSLALTDIQEARMWANAAIALEHVKT